MDDDSPDIREWCRRHAAALRGELGREARAAAVIERLGLLLARQRARQRAAPRDPKDMMSWIEQRYTSGDVSPWPCQYRGSLLQYAECRPCGDHRPRTMVPVYECTLHGACATTRVRELRVTLCPPCRDRVPASPTDQTDPTDRIDPTDQTKQPQQE